VVIGGGVAGASIALPIAGRDPPAGAGRARSRCPFVSSGSERRGRAVERLGDHFRDGHAPSTSTATSVLGAAWSLGMYAKATERAAVYA